MSTDAPLWLLDVDGVINALPDFGDAPGYTRVKVDGYRITYRPALVRRIKELHESGRVEVRWLTTWCEKASEELAPALGLPLTCVVEGSGDIYDPAYARSWWKAVTAQRVLAENPNRSVIWTDDDIAYANRKGELEWLTRFPGKVILVSPNPALGITDKQLNLIERFIAEVEEAAA